MLNDDGSLQPVLTDATQLRRPFDEAETFADECPIPFGAVLIAEQNDLAAAVGTRASPRLVEEH